MRISDWSSDVCSSDLLRFAYDRLARMPSHEREVQRPPCQAKERYPDQLPLEKETQQWHPSVEHMLQHRNVHPALMIAQHQIAGIRRKHIDIRARELNTGGGDRKSTRLNSSH